MANNSPHVSVNSRVQRRSVNRPVGYSISVDSGDSVGPIASNGPLALTDELLIEIAERFSTIDLKSLSVGHKINENIVSGRLNANQPDHIPQARRRLENINKADEDLRNIKIGRLRYHRDFFGNSFLLDQLHKCFSVLKQIWDGGDGPWRATTRQIISEILRTLSDMPDLIVDAARHDLLDSEIRGSIRMRWAKIEECLEGMVENGISNPDDTILPWRTIALRIDAAVKDSKQHDASVVPSGNSFARLNLILWSTFISTFLLTVPFLYKAWECSLHEPGTHQDADFWFLLQGCASQFVALLISSAGLSKQAYPPRWAWVPPSILAAISNILAVSIYDVVPTEWSSLCVVFGGVIQSYMVLQLAIAAR